MPWLGPPRASTWPQRREMAACAPPGASRIIPAKLNAAITRMIEISPTLRLRDDEVTIEYVRSPGPGGQNVNKVATAAQLRFRLAGSSLPSSVRERLAQLERKRVNRLGVLTLVAHTHRTQEANRREVLRKLAVAIQRAARPPRLRVATKPSRAAREKRLRAKKLRSQLKGSRSGGRGTRGQES